MSDIFGPRCLEYDEFRLKLRMDVQKHVQTISCKEDELLAKCMVCNKFVSFSVSVFFLCYSCKKEAAFHLIIVQDFALRSFVIFPLIALDVTGGHRSDRSPLSADTSGPLLNWLGVRRGHWWPALGS